MSLVHRIGIVITIALAIKGGRIPTARAMTLPDLHARQETSLAAAGVPATSALAPTDVVPVSSPIISTSVSPSAAPATSSAVTSGAAAPSTSSLYPTTASAVASLSSSASITSTSISASISNNSSLLSPSKAPNATLAEELESPLPKPNYAPGGMAFILPAFIIVGLIFIIWLIHKTKEYIWKLKEAEEAADTQSPNPGATAVLGAVNPAPKAGGVEKPPGTGMGGKWKKKGWKELESESEEDDRYGRGGGREGDRYSRVGDWQGSRKYRSRERGGEGRYPREREDEHRDGGERGRYGRLDGHDDDRYYEREPAPERRPSRREDKNRGADRQPSRDRPRSRNEAGRPHSPAPSHVSRALSKREKKERAEEWINDGRHHVAERRDSGRGGKGKDRGGKGKERERAPGGYDEYERRHITGQHFSLMPPSGPGQETQLQVQIGAAAIRGNEISSNIQQAVPDPSTSAPPLLRNKTTRKCTQQPNDSTSTPVPTVEGPSYEDVPAYMRARAASPPPILSPPFNPNLFFHNGPSTNNLVPLSTYDSGTDLESMISAQPSPLPGGGDESCMPDIPSTADKLERSATSGPGRTVRKAQTPTNSRLVARTPTRTKSHDPASAAAGTPTRADVVRTPTRRGTDGVKATGRATPTIRLIDSRGGSIRRGGETPNLSNTSGLTPKKYSKRVAPISTPTSTPETVRRVRAQKKELKARGKVDEILRDSWSERAVVSPVDAEDVDDEEEEEVEVEVEREEIRPVGRVPRDEVEMAHSRAGAISPRATSPKPAPTAASPRTKLQSLEMRPTSPVKVKPTSPGAIAGVDSADIRSLQGIDQRMALMKQLEERMKR